MESAEWLANYTRINNSFKKKLVFRLGVEAGFFSEYNNMVLAMLYCLKHHIKFELYSDYTQYAWHDAWDDFFRPFVAKNRHYINRYYSTRPTVITDSRESPLKKLVKYELIVAAYKKLFGVTYLTQDLWKLHRDRTFANTLFDIPELGFHKASVLEVTQLLIRALWQYNNQSAPLVADFITAAGLPTEYISIHVRAGDKFMETGTFDFSEYMLPAEQLTATRHAFILTDDYTVIEQLQAQYPAWQFYTLCEPTERGYFHYEFLKQSIEFKYRQHLKLFASMDICVASTKFIGTYSSNPGMFMGMRIGEERCYCLDFPHWLIW
jgi:hypothetical protein